VAVAPKARTRNEAGRLESQKLLASPTTPIASSAIHSATGHQPPARPPRWKTQVLFQLTGSVWIAGRFSGGRLEGSRVAWAAAGGAGAGGHHLEGGQGSADVGHALGDAGGAHGTDVRPGAG